VHWEFRTSAVKVDIPLLGSHGLLAALGCVLDTSHGTANFTSLGLVGYRLRRTPNGHFARA
jgi:hypothetical protein